MKAPEHPIELYPYDYREADDVLNVLARKIGEAYRKGLFHGYNDIDTSCMAFLIECGLSEEHIHRFIQLVFNSAYDEKRTQMMHERAKQKIESGEAIRGTGTFIQKLKEMNLMEIENFARQLKRATGKQAEVKDVKVESVISDQELISVCPFPFEVFPRELLNVIKRLSESLHVESELIASAMLTITSGAIGNTVKISP